MRKITVFFDFDGVVVNTISALKLLYFEILKKYNIINPKDEFDCLNGLRLPEIVKFIIDTYKPQDSSNFVFEQLYDDYLIGLNQLYDSVQLHDGIFEALCFLKENNVRIALVSSAPKIEIERVLERYLIYDYFDLILSANDAKEAKPSPEIYVKAKTQLPADMYFAIEDSLNGIISAKRAGDIHVLFYDAFGEKDLQCMKSSNQRLVHFDNVKYIIKGALYDTCAICNLPLNLFFEQGQLQIGKADEKEINDLWIIASQRDMKLFDGKIACYLSHNIMDNMCSIAYATCNYRFFYAKHISASLRDLPIRPIGVSGIIIDENNETLIGVRNKSTQYSDFYEFIPSGSIEIKCDGMITNYQEQLLVEFTEESSLDSNIIQKIIPLCLIYDAGDDVFDIGCEIRIKDSLRKYIDRIVPKNFEYKHIEVMHLADVTKQMIDGNLNFVATSYVLLGSLAW